MSIITDIVTAHVIGIVVLCIIGALCVGIMIGSLVGAAITINSIGGSKIIWRIGRLFLDVARELYSIRVDPEPDVRLKILYENIISISRILSNSDKKVIMSELQRLYKGGRVL